MHARFTLASIVVLFVSASALAQPAPWWKWQSKTNPNNTTCAQVMQGEWKKIGGPYKDGRCSIPAKTTDKASKDKAAKAKETKPS